MVFFFFLTSKSFPSPLPYDFLPLSLSSFTLTPLSVTYMPGGCLVSPASFLASDVEWPSLQNTPAPSAQTAFAPGANACLSLIFLPN